jgi:hypothetical protein
MNKSLQVLEPFRELDKEEKSDVLLRLRMVVIIGVDLTVLEISKKL